MRSPCSIAANVLDCDIIVQVRSGLLVQKKLINQHSLHNKIKRNGKKKKKKKKKKQPKMSAKN